MKIGNKLNQFKKKMIKMNSEEALFKLKQLQQLNDTEASHIAADKILCDFLISLGYSHIVEEFNKVDKWYA